MSHTATGDKSETELLGGVVVLRPDDRGEFDELLFFGKEDARRQGGKHCLVHAEMMDDKILWIGIYPDPNRDERVVVWIKARGNLSVRVEED